MKKEFIPGVKQFKNKQNILGLAWLFVVFICLINNWWLGLIVYAIYLKEYCGKEFSYLGDNVQRFASWCKSLLNYCQKFIPGMKQLESGQYYLGLLWFIATVYSYSHNFILGIILHGIYIAEHSKVPKTKDSLVTPKQEEFNNSDRKTLKIDKNQEQEQQKPLALKEKFIYETARIDVNLDKISDVELKEESKVIEEDAQVELTSDLESLSENNQDNQENNLEIEQDRYQIEEEISNLYPESITETKPEVVEEEAKKDEQTQENIAQPYSNTLEEDGRKFIINKSYFVEELKSNNSLREIIKPQVGKLLIIEVTMDTEGKYTSNLNYPPLYTTDQKANNYQPLQNMNVDFYARERGFSSSKEPMLLTGKAEILLVFDVEADSETLTLHWRNQTWLMVDS